MTTRNQSPKTKVIVLASGGLDSTACVDYYLRHDLSVELLWVNYGQKASRVERLAVHRIAKFYAVPLQQVSLKGLAWNSAIGHETEYPGRNAILALTGAASLSPNNGLVSMGIHAGTDYVDCSESFRNDIADMINLLFHGIVAADFPFGKWLKQDIAQYCVQYDVPVKLTYSCLEGTEPPCGKCESCLDRQGLQSILDKR